MSEVNNLLWCEKYRPATIEECVLPAATKAMVKEFVAKGEIPNILAFGGAGSGKTTLSKAIANEMGADLLYINASLENSVDTIRTRVIQFASTVSLSGSAKIILLDEADFLTVNAQASLRGVIEEFSNVRFFLTCNYKNRIIEALHSRTTAIDFKIDRSEMPSVMKSFFMRVKMILDAEGVKYDQKVVATVIQKYFPDFRRTINALQGCASSGAIDIATLVATDDGVYVDLFNAMKQKKFSDVRKWVGQHSDIESQQIFKDLYERSADLFELQCIPQIVLVLGDWSYKSTTSMDQELCTICALTEIMAIASWK